MKRKGALFISRPYSCRIRIADSSKTPYSKVTINVEIGVYLTLQQEVCRLRPIPGMRHGDGGYHEPSSEQSSPYHQVLHRDEPAVGTVGRRRVEVAVARERQIELQVNL